MDVGFDSKNAVFKMRFEEIRPSDEEGQLVEFRLFFDGLTDQFEFVECVLET